MLASIRAAGAPAANSARSAADLWCSGVDIFFFLWPSILILFFNWLHFAAPKVELRSASIFRRDGVLGVCSALEGPSREEPILAKLKSVSGLRWLPSGVVSSARRCAPP